MPLPMPKTITKTQAQPNTKDYRQLLAHRLQFVANTDGQILITQFADNNLWGDTASAEWVGASIESLLAQINPAWPEYLSNNWSSSPQPLFLPLEDKEGLLPYGMILEGLCMEGRVYATLSAALAPQALLRQASAAQTPTQGPAVAQLFFRLQIAEGRLSNYLQNFPGIFFSQRPDCSFSYIGPGLEAWVGKRLGALSKSGSAFLQLIAEEDREAFLSEITRRSGTHETFTLTYRLKLPDGRIIHIMDVRTPQVAPTGLILGYEGVWLDITRQAIAEDRLQRSAWKESLAVLTGGLLHDFSNIMAGIYSVSELYDSTLEAQHPWKSGLVQIQKSAREAQSLVRRILELHREVESRKDYFNLSKLIQDQTDLLKIILPKGTFFSINLSETELPVYLDDVRFRQSLLNLAVNTRDALEGNPGHISICLNPKAAGETLGKGFPDNHTAMRSGALLSFSDNAGGIPESLLPKIFNPFFTTKEATKGSGLGLYNTKLFIESCEGELGVESIQGEGTTFYLYIPITDFSEEEAQAEIEEPKRTTRRRIAVYALEDPSGFSLVERLLETEWEVMPCKGEAKLWTYLEEAPQLPHVLFLMELGGDIGFEKLVEKIKQRYPEIFIIGQLLSEQGSLSSPKLKGLFNRIMERDTPIKEMLSVLANFADKSL